MAEAAKKEAPEQKDPKKDGAKDAAAAKPKMKLDILSLATIGLIVANLGAVIGMGLFVKKLTTRVEDLQVKVQDIEKPEEPEKEEHEKDLGKELHPAAQGPLFPLDSFLVNIASDQGPKFLQTQMELELADASLEDEITRKKAAIRDAVIVLLSSRSYKDLRDQGGIKRLRMDILKAVNNLLATGKVKEIYFTQFHFN